MPQLTNDGYALQSVVNPFPVAMRLDLTDTELVGTLTPKAGEAVLGWVEKELGRTDLKDVLKSGQEVEAFRVPVGDAKVSWPKTLAGGGIKIETGGRDWVYSFGYPSSGGLFGVVNMFSSRKLAKPWKEAFKG